MRKFWKSWLCGIIAVTFTISGLSGCSLVKDTESESSSESGTNSEELGCGSVIAAGIVFPTVIFAGAVLIKKKKED